MFTSCPECGTVFRIGPADLRRAAGRARCGTCGTAFNALDSLSDSGPTEAGTGAAAAAAVSPAAPAAATPPAEPAPEALEFDVPSDRWSSFFEGPQPDPEATVDPVPLDAAAGGDWDELLADLHEDEDGEPAAVYVIDSWAGEEPVPADPPALPPATAPPAAERQPPAGEPPADYAPEQLAPTVDLPPVRERLYPAPLRAATATAAPRPAPSPAPVAPPGGDAGGETGPALPSGPGKVPPAPLRTTRPAPRRRRWPWTLGSLVLLLALAGQWVHLERDALAAHPAWGELVQQAYARLGQPLYPAWDLGTYRVLGSEAIAGRAAQDALEIVARLQVTGPAPVGLPLLRVTVRDRWGNTVGERLVEPVEYAPERSGALVAPGSVLPVTVSLRDPGTEAHGYEIDLCLPRRGQGMACQQDRPVFRR
jgi:predicted Zn finger-like uncharacterized protein